MEGIRLLFNKTVRSRQFDFQLLATGDREREREKTNCTYSMAKFTRTLKFIKDKGS
jgi:hypothetical protein